MSDSVSTRNEELLDFTLKEKSKTQDPYFVLTYLTLAKVYKEKSSPIEMIEILNKLVKLPRRTIDDAAYIEEGKKMLQDNQ